MALILFYFNKLEYQIRNDNRSTCNVGTGRASYHEQSFCGRSCSRSPGARHCRHCSLSKHLFSLLKDVLLTQSLKVAVDYGPEVHYDSTPPEAIDCSGKELINGSVPRSDVPDYWPKKKIVTIGLLSVLIVAVIVVASVVGTKKKKRPSDFGSSLQSNRSVSIIISRSAC